jgi:ubiquinone/menaquinone biosynthesis C-methylase UbiE
MFVCPDCKSQLNDFLCPQCRASFPVTEGIPILLSRQKQFSSVIGIGNTYDEIYAKHSDVWNNQGRTPEFIKYFADLLASVSVGSVLEIGCGEGFLLSAINASEKTAVDISAEALRKARLRTKAHYAVALAERLPFPDASFDMVVSVGVMEHFLDDTEATREISRVLRSGGHYAALIHVDISARQRLALKFAQYVYPHFRPLALAHWCYGKVTRSVIQPIQRRYTVQSASVCIESSGFQVSKVISKASDPHACLSGPHVFIFLAQNPLVPNRDPIVRKIPESTVVG